MKIPILILISAVFTLIAIPIMTRIVHKFGLIRKNFKGIEIPAGYGFIIVLTAVPIYIGMLFFSGVSENLLLFVSAVLGFGILGLIDDIYGTREAGGFKGHLGLLRKGKISTGLIKAAAGGLLALMMGAFIADFRVAESITNGLLIGLAANTLNLLDLRPGRAVSCFWVVILTVAVVEFGRLLTWHELIPIFSAGIWITVKDRSARIMMGDAGSNVLGGVLGLVIITQADLTVRIIVLLILAGIHIYSEKYSISRLIESNRVLYRIDRLLGER